MKALTLWRPAEWERIAAAGSGVLFRPGECECRSCLYGNREHPPAEFVEAAAACEIQHVESGGGMNGSNILWHVTGNPDNNGLDVADCINGKRRVAAVVPCPTCSIKQDGRIRPGLELCTRCVPRHWEFCSTCTVWSDDEFMITSKAGFVPVGHVVVTWGPDPVVQYGEHATVGSYVVVLVEPGSRKAFRVENHRLPVEQHELTLPPDVDPQSLVGQYAIGVEVVS